MSHVSREELSEVATGILETIVFAFTEPLDEMPEFTPGRFLTSEVSFSGIHSGAMSMTAPEELCKEWAEMMSSKASETIHLDTLAELTNIVAGHWVSKHFSDRELLKLNPPKVFPSTTEQWEKLKSDPALVLLSIDSHPLILSATVIS